MSPTHAPDRPRPTNAGRPRGRRLASVPGLLALLLSVASGGAWNASQAEEPRARRAEEEGKEAAVLRGHTAPVSHVVFSPDGKRLASAGADKTVRLWDEGGKEVAVLKGHTDQVLDMAISPDGKRLASAGWDGTVRLWGLDGKEIAVLKGH